MKIALYDNQCNFCVKTKNKMQIKYKEVTFIPRTSKRAIHMVPKQFQDTNSILFYDGTWYTHSTAIIKIMETTNKCATLLLIIPKPIRNSIYKLIAKHRNLL
jgi:predicted DCC family thiol-disulfide oxidoreductase YuxK